MRNPFRNGFPDATHLRAQNAGVAEIDLRPSTEVYFRRKESLVTKETKILNVQGMSCQHCVHAVKSSVSALAGWTRSR